LEIENNMPARRNGKAKQPPKCEYNSKC